MEKEHGTHLCWTARRGDQDGGWHRRGLPSKDRAAPSWEEAERGLQAQPSRAAGCCKPRPWSHAPALRPPPDSHPGHLADTASATAWLSQTQGPRCRREALKAAHTPPLVVRRLLCPPAPPGPAQRLQA